MPRSEKTSPPQKRLGPQARRALIMIRSLPHGAPEELLLLSGFKPEMLAELVLAGLATAVTETVHAGVPTIKVERYRITDDGRRALES
jgi:hypothetical protein